MASLNKTFLSLSLSDIWLRTTYITREKPRLEQDVAPYVAHGAMGCRSIPYDGPTELFLDPASAGVTKAVRGL